MSFLLLCAALLPWAGSAAGALFRIYAAAGVLSLEMQAVTLSGHGSLYTLPLVNAVVAMALALWQRTRGRASFDWLLLAGRVAPWPALLALGTGVLTLNLLMPLEAADPYHLERVAQIERFGTLAYDPAAIPKINVVGWVYELMLADVRGIPVAGGWLVRLHGVAGLILYLVALAAAREWLGRRARTWVWLVVLVVPVVFHQFVLIKNDLLIGIAAFSALSWLVLRAPEATPTETAQAGAFAGFAIGCKLTNLPLALLLAGGVFIARRAGRWSAIAALAAGGTIGAAAGGLFFTLYENARWYGDPLASGPVAEMGNVTSGPVETAVSLLRFAISLVDLGLLTTQWWPGRGGWGSTFGLPFVWAAALLIVHVRASRRARWALAVAAAHFVAFAAVFPDADVAHRLVLASGLLVIVVAADLVDDHGRLAAAKAALVPVLVLSAAQILRSALLYLNR